MKIIHHSSWAVATLLALTASTLAQEVREQAFDAPNQVKLKVRMEGPYTADVPLQIVCYFKYTPEAVKRMSGAPVELNKKLGGVIASLRERNEFPGDALDTLLIVPPKGSIKAQALLLIGLGPEDDLSLDVLKRVGREGLRTAARLGAQCVAFAPLIRDQGNSKLPTGDVEVAVVKEMLLAYDTEKRLQREGLAKPFTLQEWNVEAGPAYFDETVLGAQRAISEANTAIKNRSSAPYATQK